MCPFFTCFLLVKNERNSNWCLLWDPSFLFKSYRVVGWAAHVILVSAQGPLVFGLGLKGLGLRKPYPVTSISVAHFAHNFTLGWHRVMSSYVSHMYCQSIKLICQNIKFILYQKVGSTTIHRYTPSWIGLEATIVTRDVVYYILSGTPWATQECFRSNLRADKIFGFVVKFWPF